MVVVARPKGNLRQFLESLLRDDLVELAELAGVSLSQRRSIEPILKELLLPKNRSRVQDAVPEFLASLSRDDLKSICNWLSIDEGGTAKGPIVARILAALKLEGGSSSAESGAKKKHSAERPRIFIVHGHDVAMRKDVEHFLHRIGIEPIVLANEASHGKTIIEKLEEHINPDRCRHAIVLLSPDDIGHKAGRASEQSVRARQNVIFEYGMVVGKLGRRNVIALHRGDMEIPSDIHGVVYIHYEHDDRNTLSRLALELQASGYPVDMNLVWKTHS